jgi:hypothetical protein
MTVDEAGRSVFLVSWGRPGRSDWQAVLVVAHDPDEARTRVAEAFPERFRPQHALPAAEATTRAVLAGRHDPTVSHLPVLD